MSDVIKEDENENTIRKTKQNVALLQEFLALKVKALSNVSRIIQLSSTECSKGQQAMSLFSGAVIHGGQISISINDLNQSPTLSSKCSPSKRYKRLKMLSDSDSD